MCSFFHRYIYVKFMMPSQRQRRKYLAKFFSQITHLYPQITNPGFTLQQSDCIYFALNVVIPTLIHLDDKNRIQCGTHLSSLVLDLA